jgi:hypothetical protein
MGPNLCVNQSNRINLPYTNSCTSEACIRQHNQYISHILGCADVCKSTYTTEIEEWEHQNSNAITKAGALKLIDVLQNIYQNGVKI